MIKAYKTIKASGITVHCSHTEIVDIETLTPNPRNPNEHPDKQIVLLAKIIREQGWRNPIVISNRSGFIVKGHGRLEAAKLLNVATVPIDRQDYVSEASEWQDMIADNRISEIAELNTAVLKDLLQELDDGGVDMDLTGFMEDELETLMTQFHAEGEPIDLDPPPDGSVRPVKCPKCGFDFEVHT